MIPEVLVETAKRFIKRDMPFGPTNTEKIRDRSVAELLFDRENKLHEAIDGRPSIILGRRGSGKTANLQSVYFLSPDDIIIEIEQQKIFERVLMSVEKIVKNVVLAETVADVWNTLLYVVALQRLVSHEERLGKRLSIVRDYLGKLGMRDEERADDILWNVVDILAAKLHDKPIGIIAQVLKVFDNVTFDDAMVEAKNALNGKGLRCILLLDSLENFPFEIPHVTHSIRGLLRCIGAFNGYDHPFELRFCLPAELYHSFLAISANPLKDFERSVTLHWHPKELLLVIAKRIYIYLELYEPLTFAKIRELAPDNKSDALKIFHTVFPQQIRNGRDFEENCVGYLLRHTQLLPRQLLRLLNSIAAANRRLGHPALEISPEAVVKGIAEEERLIAEEIFSGFSARYPAARKCCEATVPELQLSFSNGALHKVFVRHAKKYFDNGDYDDFKRMLIEIGAIGRVVGRTEFYIEGIFEYTEPHKLGVSVNDELCLHPIFAGAFGRKLDKGSAPKVAVYPYGADMELDDWRIITNGS